MRKLAEVIHNLVVREQSILDTKELLDNYDELVSFLENVIVNHNITDGWKLLFRANKIITIYRKRYGYER